MIRTVANVCCPGCECRELHKTGEGGVFNIQYKNSHYLKRVPVIVGRLG